MKFLVVIPVYNEEAYLENTVRSLLAQSHAPHKLVLVDDGSKDGSWDIIQRLALEYSGIIGVQTKAQAKHQPGSKVVRAFQVGLDQCTAEVDVICKFDSDLIFPPNYLAEIARAFQSNQSLGICGGVCVVEKEGKWIPEMLSDADHVRGALKAYRKECFDDIGGLRPAMGWDTIDELLALYHGWEVQVLPSLEVKHLRVTGKTYTSEARYLKGQALYGVGYGFLLSLLASAKIAQKEGSIFNIRDHLMGYFGALRSGKAKMVTKDEARFIRRYRWRRMRQKFFGG